MAAITLTSTKGNYFLIGNTRYPKNSLIGKFEGDYLTIKYSDGRIYIKPTKYDNITNGDTASLFANIAAVKTWWDANAYTTEGVKTVSAEVTRPADTTAYAAKDAIANSTSAPTVITFTGAVNNIGESGVIRKATLQTDQAANTSTFRLHLFNAAPTTLTNDNAAQLIDYADKASYLGYIDITNVAEAGSSIGVNTNAFHFVSGATVNLFGMLESVGGFTPASGQKFNIKLVIES